MVENEAKNLQNRCPMRTKNIGNRDSWPKDLLGTTCLSNILLAADVQLIARITVSWDEIEKAH